MKPTLLIFIHGIASGPQAWDILIELLKADEKVAGRVDYQTFEYETRLIGNRFLTRTPTYRTVADKLRTRFLRYREEYEQIIFVTHSQGGLVLQTFLSRMLAGGEAEKLTVIKKMVLIACPNGGSGIFLTPRRSVGWLFPHAQERRLRPLDEEIADIHRHVVSQVDKADRVSPNSCPIPLIAFAAESDGIVLRASAYGHFRSHGILPGSHKTVIRPSSPTDPGYLDLRNEILGAVRPAASARPATPSSPAPLRPASTGGRTALHNLPRMTTSRLIGRDSELAYLRTFLGQRTGEILLIEGTAGAGKTTLALHISHEMLHSNQYDTIIWLSARTTILQTSGEVPTATSTSDLADLTTTIAITLDRRDLLRLPPPQRAIGVVAALAEMSCLLVLDNFETVADTRILPYLRDLPQSCSILITSRRRVDVRRRVSLQPLNPGQSAELVRSELERRHLSRPPTTVDWIAETSGGIPLAVQWLVGRLASGAPHLAPGPELDDDEMLRYLFQSAVDHVSDEGGSVALRLLAHPPGTIPSRLLENALLRLGMQHSDITRTISVLSTLNLVGYDQVTDRYSVLPIIKRFVLEKASLDTVTSAMTMEQIGDAYVPALAEHLRIEADVLWRTGYELGDWDRDRANCLTSIHNLLNQGKVDLAAELLQAFYPFAITFGHFDDFLAHTSTLLAPPFQLAPIDGARLKAHRTSVLFHSGDVDRAEMELARAEQEYRLVLAPDDALTDSMFFVRSIIAVSRRSPTAEAILNEAVTFARRRGVVWALIGFQGWLALHLIDMGRLDEADGLLRETLARCAADGDHRTAVFLNVGMARLRLALGEHDKVIDSADDVLALARKYGEDHNWAHLHYEVARAYAHRDDTRTALNHLAAARELYVRIGAGVGIESCDALRAQLAP